MDQPDDFRRLVGLAHAVARELTSRKVAGDTYEVSPARNETVEVGFLFKKKETRHTPAQNAEIGGWRVFSRFEKEDEVRIQEDKYRSTFERDELTRQVWLRFDGTLESVDFTTHFRMWGSAIRGGSVNDPPTVSRSRLRPGEAFRLDQQTEVRSGRPRRYGPRTESGNYRYYHRSEARTTVTLRAALEELRKR